MVCSERNPETTRRTKFHTRRLSPSAVAISMRPESVRLNVVARCSEARAAAAFWACVCFAALSSRPAGGLRFRIEPQRILPAALLRIELFLRTPGRSAPAATAGLASPVFAREKRRTTGELWLGLGFELGLG